MDDGSTWVHNGLRIGRKRNGSRRQHGDMAGGVQACRMPWLDGMLGSILSWLTRGD